jgi:hypothetical protein
VKPGKSFSIRFIISETVCLDGKVEAKAKRVICHTACLIRAYFWRNAMKKRVIITGIAAFVLLAAIGGFAVLRWAFSDHKFRCKDLNYWLLTDREFRAFPVIGAEQEDVRYESNFQDGTKPGMLRFSYETQMSAEEVIAAYQSVGREKNYTLLLLEGSDGLNFLGKGDYEYVSIAVEERPSEKNWVEVCFIMRLGR